jgi:hypothetical protein
MAWQSAVLLSTTASTHCYELVHGCPPVVPPATRASFQAPLSLDDPSKAAEELAQRSKLINQELPLAMANLQAAQHTDHVGRFGTALARSRVALGPKSSKERPALATPVQPVLVNPASFCPTACAFAHCGI